MSRLARKVEARKKIIAAEAQWQVFSQAQPVMEGENPVKQKVRRLFHAAVMAGLVWSLWLILTAKP